MVALTLTESAKLAANAGLDQKAAVVATFARESDLLRALAFMPINGSAYGYNVEGAMPGVAFRGINEGYTPNVGVINPQTEALKIIGGELDVDVAIVKMHGPQTRAWQEAAKVKQMARQVSFELIEGDSSTNPKAFDGIRWRIPLTGTQALDVSATNAVSMVKLDELIEMVDNPTHLLMTKATARGINAYLRSSGTAVQMSKDEFGRPLMSYNGLPILIADRNGSIAGITFNQNATTETGGSEGSLYVLSIGMDAYHGLQNGEMEVTNLGVLQSAPLYRTRVEWLVAQCIEHPRAVARGYGFTAAGGAAA